MIERDVTTTPAALPGQQSIRTEALAESLDAPPTALPPPPPVPSVPRSITRAARRRSWNEAPVRIWAILTLVIGLIAIYVTVTRVRDALRDRWLILHGTQVQAKFLTVQGVPVVKRWPRNEAMGATLLVPLPGGRTHELDIRLEPKPNSFARVGDELTIRVDPNRPDFWTEQTETRPWRMELVAPALLLPLVAILVGITVWRRQGVLRVWRQAPLAPVEVVQVDHTAMAPRSRIVRFARQDSDDRRLGSALVPVHAGIPSIGETLWLVVPPVNPHRAIVARLYLDGERGSS
jgi:hypothetical protein